MGNDHDWMFFIRTFKDISSIDLRAYKRPQMERRIISFMNSNGFDNYQDFLNQLKNDREFLKKFTEHLTINVSEFFRNASHWQVLQDEIIPELIANRGGPLKIWSAGCSTGEEAYSLAMLIHKNRMSIDKHILATDLDRVVLSKAIKGIYSEKEIEGVPKEYRDKYLTNTDDGYQVSDDIKKMVKFEQHDLLKDRFGSDFDLILCRNVVIYFTEETKKELYSNFVKALCPHGVIFVGSTEQIFNAREMGLQSRKIFFYIKQ